MEKNNMKLTEKLNNLIGGAENAVAGEAKKVATGVKNTVNRVKSNVAADQQGLKNGTVGRNQFTNPLR